MDKVIHLKRRQGCPSAVCPDSFRVPPSGDFLERLSAVLYPPRRTRYTNPAEILVVDFGQTGFIEENRCMSE
jgi:hypothetical protein